MVPRRVSTKRVNRSLQLVVNFMWFGLWDFCPWIHRINSGDLVIDLSLWELPVETHPKVKRYKPRCGSINPSNQPKGIKALFPKGLKLYLKKNAFSFSFQGWWITEIKGWRMLEIQFSLTSFCWGIAHASSCWVLAGEDAKKASPPHTLSYVGNLVFCMDVLLTMPKPLTVWITINCGKFWKRWEYQTTWPASWETCLQFRKQQLEQDMEQQIASK